MAYYYAVNLTGTIEPAVINHTMKTMGTLNTFARKVNFLSNGTNEHAFVAPIQYDADGIGRAITQTSIVYPAPFYKSSMCNVFSCLVYCFVINTNVGSTNVKLIVAIVVPIGMYLVI